MTDVEWHFSRIVRHRMSSWGCPHEINGQCEKVAGRPCDPGMKGCVLAGRYVFANEDKNARLREKQAREAPPPDDTTKD